MSAIFEQNLNILHNSPAILATLTTLQRGIEKESLRVQPDGKLALTPHPTGLGSALCHPKITTDYSESLLEFITPVHHSVHDCLEDLNDIHHFVYKELHKQDEMLWSASMPCQLGNANTIPVAQYGTSNVAKMKTIYRLGLGHRYGRAMQTISGIHYNFSLSDKFWASYRKIHNNNQTLPDFKTTQYFALIRNFRRLAPLLIYLFGASPALCRSFLQDQKPDLTAFDEHTWYSEYATSLRMGDLGYQSSAQDALSICYNNLDHYIASLRKAITEPHAIYENIGVKDEQGEYKQLSTSLLQIENEFYSLIRPKRVSASNEAPINALARGGIEYIEVRCLDINPFTAAGIDSDTIHFLDLFLLYCLFIDSPPCHDDECKMIRQNQKNVVKNGRAPDFKLQFDDNSVLLREWAPSLLQSMQPLAQILDSLNANNTYQTSLADQLEKIIHPELTPSARVLQQMREQQLPFARFARQQSEKWRDHFTQLPLPVSKDTYFKQLAADSIVQQKTIELSDNIPFDQYLLDFYKQY